MARVAAAQGPAAPPPVQAPPSGSEAPAPRSPAPAAAPSQPAAAGFGSVQASESVPAPASQAQPPPPQGAPPPVEAPPRAEAPPGGDPYSAPVPVWLTGDSGETANVAIYPEWAQPGSVPPIARCTLPCGFQMPRGRYRISVAETSSTLGGNRPVTVDGPVRLVVKPRDRSTRTVGLVLGIGGIAAVVGGIALMADGFNTYYRCDSEGFCNQTSTFTSEAGAGLAVFLAGAALTPIGWVMFGKSFRPAVDVEHPGQAAVLRPRLGVIPLRGGAGLGGSFVF